MLPEAAPPLPLLALAAQVAPPGAPRTAAAASTATTDGATVVTADLEPDGVLPVKTSCFLTYRVILVVVHLIWNVFALLGQHVAAAAAHLPGELPKSKSTQPRCPNTGVTLFFSLDYVPLSM